MTAWTDESTTETEWAATTPFTQIIDLINNEFSINYDLVNINGISIRKGTNQPTIETAWRDEA